MSRCCLGFAGDMSDHRRRLAAAVLVTMFCCVTALGLNREEKFIETIIDNHHLKDHQQHHHQRELNRDINSSLRQIGGLGSFPPTCRLRCGSCSPCRAEHVAIHPGVSTPLDYYPEAWRCKCGNKLFLP